MNVKLNKRLFPAVLAFSLAIGSLSLGLATEQKAVAASETVVIAEVFNASSATGEWVTLANISDTAVNLQGWKLQDYSAAGNAQGAWTFPAVSIAPNSLLVVERSAGASDAQATGVDSIVGGLFNFAAGSDRLDLINAGSNLVDGVAWGGDNQVEGFSVTVPAEGFRSGQSLERTSRLDTDAAINWAFVTEAPSAGHWAPLAQAGSPVVLTQLPANGSTVAVTDPEVKAVFTFGEGQPLGTAELVLKQGATNVASSSLVIDIGGGQYEIGLASLSLTAGEEYTAELTVTSGGGTTVSTWSFWVQELGAGGIVISEIYPDALDETNSEFFELYNPTANEIDISGYTFGSTSVAGNDNEQGTIPANTKIPAGGYYLVGDAAELTDGLGTWAEPDLVTPLTVANSNGAYWLRDAAGNLVDRVSWGSNPHGEGTPYPLNPATRASLERLANDGSSPLPDEPGEFLGNGWDTNNNAVDFVVRALPEPQNSGSDFEPQPE